VAATAVRYLLIITAMRRAAASRGPVSGVEAVRDGEEAEGGREARGQSQAHAPEKLEHRRVRARSVPECPPSLRESERFR